MSNKKPIIGILPTSNYMMSNDTFADTYRYGNNYIKKIVDNGGIPLLLPYKNDEIIWDSVKMCDGLLLPGGNRVTKSNLEVLDYFYKESKPILGICLGMQTIGIYSVNIENDEPKKVIKIIDNGVDHWPVELFRDNNDEVVHNIKIEEDTKLFDIFGEKSIKVNSVHKCTITEIGKKFKISAKSEDGLIEGIEYNGDDKFIIGVQFHPEVLDQYNVIFEKFIEACINI